MSIALITGSCGLIGSEAARFFGKLGMDVVGIDNDMRSVFFGPDASTAWQKAALARTLPENYEHHDLDIRNQDGIETLFKRFGSSIELIIHTAAQPSHDWAASDPATDFSVNATGTLNLLNATRKWCDQAVFIFTSTNKVYGDTPNRLPLVEKDIRWELEETHPFFSGIPEEMSIDQSLHSVFGASKVAADVMVQEFGHYFGIRSACFRGGCLTGPDHSGAKLHGFLAYLMKCAVSRQKYSVLGYKGKQVRDNIHSSDLIQAFHEFFKKPRVAEVYNIGGGRRSNCSMLEAIDLCEDISGERLDWEYLDENRIGDHIWWISDVSKFETHYPNWKPEYNIRRILEDIYEANRHRWKEQIPV